MHGFFLLLFKFIFVNPLKQTTSQPNFKFLFYIMIFRNEILKNIARFICYACVTQNNGYISALSTHDVNLTS